MKVFDITMTTRGYRVEIPDDVAENIQEKLAVPGTKWVGIPGIRPGVEMTWLNVEHIVAVEIENARTPR